MIRVGHGIRIPENDLHFRFVRSRGPGGQHVNRASTAVQLSFNVSDSESLPDRVKRRLHKLAPGQMTTDGTLIIFADRFRSQRRNRRDAIDRLTDLIRTAAAPTKRRIRTKPSAASVQRRLDAKKRRGRRKKERRWRPRDEE